MKNSQLGNWALRNYESFRPGPYRVHSFSERTTIGAGSRGQSGWRSGKRVVPYISSQHHTMPRAKPATANAQGGSEASLWLASNLPHIQGENQ